MDNLVLIRVAAAMDAALRRAVLADVVEESKDRVRFAFDTASRPRSVVVSLQAELPWIGAAAGRWEARRKRATPFANALRAALRGGVLVRVRKTGPDRIVRLEWGDGHVVVAELATHGANLILLDAGGRVTAVARHPRSSQRRLAPGAVYLPPAIPARLFVPFGRTPEEIDAAIAAIGDREPELLERLRRQMFGVGTDGARLVVDEATSSGRSVGEVLARRLAAIERGEADPVIVPDEDPLDAALAGTLDEARLRLLPWAAEGSHGLRRNDAAATAGLYHEAVEQARRLRARAAGLRSIVERELRRLSSAERRAALDHAGFGDPDTHRRWGEALLAGLSTARRHGEVALVADPYDPTARDLAVPVAPGVPLAEAAAGHFQASRRARRGLDQARRRLDQLAARRVRLEGLIDRGDGLGGVDAIRSFEAAMLAERIPVGLEPDRRSRATARLDRPRLEGVRVFETTDGSTILVGKGGRENHRLTFRLSAPEDFWLHVEDAPGAHVILRNPERAPEPPPRALDEAAAIAAWYSDLRGDERVTVRWTQRKNVRKPRGATPGTVTLKRFRTVRARPRLPDEASAAR